MGGGLRIPTPGAYYFLPEGSEFEQRSMLGGHWFEGTPYQTGDWATLPEPAPTWRNGSIPGPPLFPVIGPCEPCERFKIAAITGGTWEYQRLDTGELRTVTATYSSPGGLNVFQDIFAPLVANVVIAYVEAPFCHAEYSWPPGTQNVDYDRNYLEFSASTPSYINTFEWFNRPARWPDGLDHNSRIRLRVEGTLPP